MARDHARVRLDIWNDADFRALPSGAQWLYFYLMTERSLSFCGIADWRPARIAAVTAELRADDIEWLVVGLERPESGAAPFVVVDRDAEEVMVRSFIKHDGLMRSPNTTTAMVNAYGRAASSTLRAVIIDQLLRLKEARPELSGWAKVPATMLDKAAAMTPAEAIKALPPNPSAGGVHPLHKVAEP